MRLSLSVGSNRHYKLDEITKRHFVQTGEAAALPKKQINNAIESIANTIESALEKIENELPNNFPESIHQAVKSAVKTRVRKLLK